MINICKDSVDPRRSCSGKARIVSKFPNITIEGEGKELNFFPLSLFLLSSNQDFHDQ